MSTYRHVLAFLRGKEKPGNILEIGVLMGEGTRQLAEAYPERTVYALDIFDIEADQAVNSSGTPMVQFYREALAGRDQWRTFAEHTAGLRNVTAIVGDSREADWPEGDLFLIVIDGGHAKEVVEHDLRQAIWCQAAYIAVHDYNHDLPEVAKVVNRLAKKHGYTIHEVGNVFAVLARP